MYAVFLNTTPGWEIKIAFLFAVIGVVALFLAMTDKISDKTGWLLVQISFWGMIAMIFVAAAGLFI